MMSRVRKGRTNRVLSSVDNRCRELGLKNDALHGHLTLLRKLQKAVNQMRDNKAVEAHRKFEKQREKLEAELNSERAQNSTLAEELCDELRVQRVKAELQLVEVEGDNWRATDRTREELVERVNRCLRGYTRWEVAAQERITLRELEICAVDLMSGESRSRRRVAKRLHAFQARSQDAIAKLEAEVTAVLRRLGLGSRVEDWSGRDAVRGRPSHRRHSRIHGV
ncbi:hypothetical protein AXG93_3267s1080 [Marchantia polymorpha subsp. ruderalis]|uniref:Uncharacterized protein n=1 Tax=Marchantia polymorpha subsp. ruderalis TaxID=1480154 RepID=A0A176WNC0_MARPO|nr:hypothetical protein AXG93_3267s1080 [Marchantia polymorpha subsp. ruderalis]